ncbi:MAG: hypothetical protein OXG58_07760 [Gemmatimonadetes bacterium]|nr:hypothetical protein [Gemmatimonadota bacterium]MCY3943232.1 hypothetical protein [Gemmatimonadota bacterium]
MRTPTISTQLPMPGFRALRRSSVLVAGALLAACNGPPRVCGDEIPEQELFTGEDVRLEPCFVDPEGEKLTLEATSSEEPVATAQVYGLEVNIQAISPGNADVTVTATDPGGRSASLGFGVLVPNRPPHADGELSEIGMLADDTTELPIDLYFADPDGEPLTFAATSGDPSVASASIRDLSTLVVAGLADGATTVTLTATDPGELTGERTVDVRVLEPVLIFRDDFDSNNYEWAFNFALHYLYRDGLLHLRNRYSHYFGVGDRRVNVAEWEYRASVGVEEGGENAECQAVGLGSFRGTGSSWAWALFAERSYRIVGPGGVNERGSSDAVRVVGERTEMVWTSRLGVMTLAAGETVLARLDHELFAPWSPELMDRARLVVATACTDTYRVALYDWAELWAVEADDEP